MKKEEICPCCQNEGIISIIIEEDGKFIETFEICSCKISS